MDQPTNNSPRSPRPWREPRRWLLFIGVLAIACLLFALLPTRTVDALQGRPIGHWSSVLPPLLAVLIALCFRRLVTALVSAFVFGCVLAAWPDALAAVPIGIRDFIWVKFTEQFNLYIFAFLFALVGMVHVVYRGGGIHGLVRLISRAARGPRSTRVATFLAGLLVFFDDYSNTIVVGSAMRGLTDKWRVSREKLAYLVDSTSAPIAGVALLSTWIAFEVFLFTAAAGNLGLAEGGYAIFVTILPYRFYCWGTLLFVFLSSALGRDFGPMLRAETRAALDGKLLRDGARPLVRGGEGDADTVATPARAINAALPLLLVVGGTLGGIVLLGRYLILSAGGTFAVGRLADWREAFGMVTNPYVTPGGAMLILFLAACTAGLCAVVMLNAQHLLSLRQAGGAYLKATPTLAMAFFILIMAWGMGEICTKGVHTDTYLISLLGDRVPLTVLPLIVFAIASGMAFATGTSFGTMGILIPVVFELAHALGAYDAGNRHIFWLCAAAIMDGAIFGDHCSPISDTTVLSSIASGCDHVDHVATQMPYAVTVMLIAAALGYILSAVGLGPIVFFTAFPVVAVGVLFALGRRVPRIANTTRSRA